MPLTRVTLAPPCASNRQPTACAEPCSAPPGSRKIRDRRSIQGNDVQQAPFLFTALSCGLISIPATALLAQQNPAPPATSQQQAQPAAGQNQGQEPNPLKRQLSDKERSKAQKALRQELKGPYKTWLNEEVPYIITDEERKAFMSLSNDEEREAFIENFWLRRNPNPDSPENEFREEHYRRIAYANEHFAAGKPGWKTDRGRIYIMWGPADSIDSHPSGGMYERPMEEGGGETSTFPFEVWHYRYLEGIGENIDLEFVDTCQCGDYHFTIDRSEKDALKYVPGAGLTQYEEMKHKDKTDRFKGGGFEQLGTGPMGIGAAGQRIRPHRAGRQAIRPAADQVQRS